MRPAASVGEFVRKLFDQEVPEVYDGVIEIRPVRRNPREGWAEDAQRLAEERGDALVWPELANEGDEALVW